MLALTELAQRGSARARCRSSRWPRRRGIPLHFLEQIFAGLRRAGVLQSQRGVKGGYSFRRPPVEVSILEVVETVDGRITPPGGADGAARGPESVWTEARATLAELLAGLTIADMQEREARLQSAPMFHIYASVPSRAPCSGSGSGRRVVSRATAPRRPSWLSSK